MHRQIHKLFPAGYQFPSASNWLLLTRQIQLGLLARWRLNESCAGGSWSTDVEERGEGAAAVSPPPYVSSRESLFGVTVWGGLLF